MLDETTQRIANLPLQTKATIERMAFATQVAQLREDLIPQEHAVQIVEEHKQAETEEWKRAISALWRPSKPKETSLTGKEI